MVYFFEGSVFIGDQPLEQKFGKFPDVGQGGVLRTEQGRAEILLTPGVFLRVGENTQVRLISNQLSDTRVELVMGSAILESDEVPDGNSVTLSYQNWQARVPGRGVYRIDAEPAQVRVYKGDVRVAVSGSDSVTAKEGETLPLAPVLVTERTAGDPTDSFSEWAMSRSQAIDADNTVASQIFDDPPSVDASSLALGGFSYFPPIGVGGMALTSPYGLSFWSPFQSSLNTLYRPSYLYGPSYPAWPGVVRYPGLQRPWAGRTGVGLGVRPIGVRPIAPVTPSPRAPITAPVHTAAPHGGIHAVGHR
jgi:hypothetical protein